MMGKTRTVSKGYSTGFVPDYRHAVETVAESECFGSSGRVVRELTSLQDSSGPNRKYVSLNIDGYDRSLVPIWSLSLSTMSPSDRRDLEVRLKSELEQVRKLQRKIASFSLDAMVHPSRPKRPAMVENLVRSANDELVTPGKKKCPSERNGHRKKGEVVAAREMGPVKRGVPQSTNIFMLMKQCDALLHRLMSQKQARIFNQPVDIVEHNAPDYFNIIKYPMDLGTVKSKILSNQYSSPVEFAADVRLTFKNAMTFNPPKHLVHVMAETLSKFFEVRWKTIEKKIRPTAGESTASKSNVIIEPESTYVPSPKKLKTTSIEAKVKHESEKQTMSDIDKEKLGAELEELIAELPDNIINFLKESTLSSSQVIEDEIEIDIDALTDDTLSTLRKLLDDYLLERKQKQSTLEHHEIETWKEPGSGDLSHHPCKDKWPDEDVDIGRHDPPPISSSPPIQSDKDAAQRKSNCSSSSDSDSGSSAYGPDGANSSVPVEVNETTDTKEPKESDLVDPNIGDFSKWNAEQYSVSNSLFVEPNFRQQGESATSERQVSPEKLYRAALLRSRFADIIIKARENTIEKGERPDPEKLKLEREELEKRRREEKARLQAEAKAAEDARRKAEVEAAAEARKKRELEREAARQALQKMEKTVDINENSHFMEDLEMFRSAPDEHLQGLIDETSPENSQNCLGSFKFQANSNPLEQLGLYMKNNEEEEDDIQLESIQLDSNDTEEGEID